MRRKQRNPSRAADPIYVDDVPVPKVGSALSEPLRAADPIYVDDVPVPKVGSALSELRSENTRLRKRVDEISRERDRRNAQIVLVVEQYNRAMTEYRDAVSDLARLRKRARTTLSYWKKIHRDARQCISDTAYDALTGWDSERKAEAERKEREEDERAMEYLRCKFPRRKKSENWTEAVHRFRKVYDGAKNGKRVRRACLQCGAVKTPQWRMGPEGKKTLCNACGVKHLKRERAYPLFHVMYDEQPVVSNHNPLFERMHARPLNR